MRGWHPIALLVAALTLNGASALSVDEVVELSQAGVSDDVILAQIEADGSRYVLTTAVIRRLHEQGVSDRVVEAMVRTRTTTANGRRSSERYSAGSTTVIDGGLLGSSVSIERRLVVVPSYGYSGYSSYPFGSYAPPVTLHVGPNPPLFVNLPQGSYQLTPGLGYHHHRPSYQRRPCTTSPSTVVVRPRPSQRPSRPSRPTTMVVEPYGRRDKAR